MLDEALIISCLSVSAILVLLQAVQSPVALCSAGAQ